MTVRIGVVGAGALGFHHTRILRDVPGAQLAGFYEASAARAEKVSSELGVKAFGSLDALLDVVDAVSVVVPTPAHYAVAAPALERGLHVLIEKPIATTLEEADGLLAIAKRTGAVLQTGHVERFNRAVRAALPFVESPRFIESNRLAPFNPRGSDVAVVLDLMIHDIDLVRTFVGGAVTSVSAVGVPVLTPFVDIANARLSFEAGAVANITASRVSRERLRKLRIFQQSGYLSLDLGAGSGEFYALRKDVDLLALVRDAQGAQALESFVERVPVEGPDGEPLRLELEAFVQAVAGEAPIAVTGEDGREALAVALTIVHDIERTMQVSPERFRRAHVREILFVAGEVSGDLHASGVARALKARGAPFQLTAVGGDQLRAAGAELIEHIEGLAVMGFIEPLKRLPKYRALLNELTRRIQSGNVALVVLIDHAAFNMRVAAVAAEAKVPVLYFITPQVWASRPGRMARLAETVTQAAVILPFEEKLLRANGVNATFVGHPLLDRAAELPTKEAARARLGLAASDRVLALFPGSRAQEIRRHLDPFVATAQELQRRIPGLKVVVSAAPHVDIDPTRCPFEMVRSESFTLLRAADAALCKSGTTTLEAAVAGCPLAVAYRARQFDYAVGKWLVKIPHIGLVNIVAGKLVAPEFIQDALQPMAVADALEPLLDLNSAKRRAMVAELDAVRASLGTPGAAERVADIAMDLIRRGADGR